MPGCAPGKKEAGQRSACCMLLVTPSSHPKLANKLQPQKAADLCTVFSGLGSTALHHLQHSVEQHTGVAGAERFPVVDFSFSLAFVLRIISCRKDFLEASQQCE